MTDDKVFIAFTLRAAMSIGDACVLHLVDGTGGLRVASLHHRQAEATPLLAAWLSGGPPAVTPGLAADVVHSGQALFIPVVDPEHLRRFAPPGGDLYLRHRGIQSLLMLPVPGTPRALGVVSLLRDRGGRSYTADDRQMLRRLTAGLERTLADSAAVGAPGDAAGRTGAERSSDAAGGSGEACSILVVEDEPAVRELVREILQREGYSVLEAANAEQALAVLSGRQQPLDLLLTDMVMPGMSGAALADLLRGRHPSLRALFMSGYVDQTMVPWQGPEPVPFLQKPFTLDALLRSVRAALAGGVAG